MTRTKKPTSRRCAVASAAADDKGVIMLNSTDELEALLATAKAEKRKCVLNVSSSKCGPCKLLLPTLQESMVHTCWNLTTLLWLRLGCSKAAPHRCCCCR